MLTNVTIDGSITLTSGLLRTNGNTLTVAGTNATPVTGTSSGAAATSYIATVSYTHLDVYKRQLLVLANVQPGGNVLSTMSAPAAAPAPLLATLIA